MCLHFVLHCIASLTCWPHLSGRAGGSSDTVDAVLAVGAILAGLSGLAFVSWATCPARATTGSFHTREATATSTAASTWHADALASFEATGTAGSRGTSRALLATLAKLAVSASFAEFAAETSGAWYSPFA